jgi:hypothetical protein
MEQAWECPDTTPQYWSCRLCAKSGVWADQHNLQHPTSVNITSNTWQVYLWHSTISITRNQERHHLQKDESAPLCTASNNYPTSHSTSTVYSTIRRLCSYLQYIVVFKYSTPRSLRLCYNYKKSTSPDMTLHWNTHAPHPPPSCHYKIFLSPSNTIPPVHNLHTENTYRIA